MVSSITTRPEHREGKVKLAKTLSKLNEDSTTTQTLTLPTSSSMDAAANSLSQTPEVKDTGCKVRRQYKKSGKYKQANKLSLADQAKPKKLEKKSRRRREGNFHKYAIHANQKIAEHMTQIVEM